MEDELGVHFQLDVEHSADMEDVDILLSSEQVQNKDTNSLRATVW